MVILNHDLLDEIENFKEKIDKRKLKNLVDSLFDDMSEKTILNASLQDGDNAQRKDEVMLNFTRAWDYAMFIGGSNFEIHRLEQIAGLVEPCLRAVGKDYAAIRKGGGTAIPGIKYVPPVDEFRIRTHLERMAESIKMGGFHPVEEAVFIYFNLVRVQPFSNANKRTANIIMNSSLLREGFAPISIPANQSGVFDGYFQGALQGFRIDGSDSDDVLKPYLQPGKEQLRFYDYLGRIERNRLAQLEDYLKGLPHSVLTFKCKDPGPLYTLKKKVSCWCNHNNLSFQISLDAKARTMEVVGDIPVSVFDKLVDETRQIKSYKISSKLDEGNLDYHQLGRLNEAARTDSKRYGIEFTRTK